MSARSPVVTGLGIVAAVGSGVAAVWDSIARGASGLSPLTLFPSPRYGQVLTGEIRADLCALGAPKRGSRSDKLGWLAAQEAINHSRVTLSDCADRAGIILGSSVGGSFDSERFLTTLLKTGRMRAGPTRFHECSSTVDLIADDFGLFGPSLTIATACSSSALAIAAGGEMILGGEADLMLVGGSDSLSRMTWGGFHSLLLVDPAGCRPFDANRGGMSLGEGAAVLVLEAEEFAQRRGATILARLSGWAGTCDAHHTTAPHPEGAGALAAMQAALRRAGLGSESIDYVNAHGTGTRDNDLAEARALKTLFGDRLPPFSSTKRFFGHALAASGAIEAVVCIEAMRHQQLPPNPGFSAPDPTIGLQPVTMIRKSPMTHVMSNSFGFGGNNGVLIFSEPGARTTPRPIHPNRVAITGIGLIGPGTVGIREIEPPLPPGNVSVHDCGPLADAAQLTPNQRRRTSRLVQMALLAARRSHTPDPTKRVAVAIGSGMGCLGAAGIFLENLISKDEQEPMPSQFPGSVHNAAASQVAIDLGARGLNSAPTMGEISFESALWQGISQLNNAEADCALVGAVDELNKYLLGIGKRWRAWDSRTRPGEGAMVASLTRAGAALPTPLAQVTAVRLGRYRRPFNAIREAAWVESAIDLSSVEIVLTGAQGWPALDPFYAALVIALAKCAGRPIEHQTYKQQCGEFHSASAFGFYTATELARTSRRGVLLYTLSLKGAKALSCIQP